jgi:chromosome partitioning protein
MNHKAKVISIVNQKGGVGKTTTAVNLASSLVEVGKKVLLIDFDPQGNATSGIGLKPDCIEHCVYHLLIDAKNVEKVLLPTVYDNLHVIPASRDLAGAEVELVNLENRETRLRDAIKPLRDFYDYIVIDCAPSLGLLTINALAASDKAIIPVQCEYFALEGIAGLVQTLTQVKEYLNPNLEIAGIVLTMYDRRTSLNKQVVDNTRRFFRDLVFDTIVPRNIRLSEAPSHGIPISLYDGSSAGAIAYKSLAEEVICRV